MTVYSVALLLFLVMDPIGNIPFFLTTLQNGIDPDGRGDTDVHDRNFVIL